MSILEQGEKRQASKFKSTIADERQFNGFYKRQDQKTEGRFNPLSSSPRTLETR